MSTDGSDVVAQLGVNWVNPAVTYLGIPFAVEEPTVLHTLRRALQIGAEETLLDILSAWLSASTDNKNAVSEIVSPINGQVFTGGINGWAGQPVSPPCYVGAFNSLNSDSSNADVLPGDSTVEGSWYAAISSTFGTEETPTPTGQPALTNWNTYNFVMQQLLDDLWLVRNVAHGCDPVDFDTLAAVNNSLPIDTASLQTLVQQLQNSCQRVLLEVVIGMAMMGLGPVLTGGPISGELATALGEAVPTGVTSAELLPILSANVAAFSGVIAGYEASLAAMTTSVGTFPTDGTLLAYLMRKLTVPKTDSSATNLGEFFKDTVASGSGSTAVNSLAGLFAVDGQGTDYLLKDALKDVVFIDPEGGDVRHAWRYYIGILQADGIL